MAFDIIIGDAGGTGFDIAIGDELTLAEGTTLAALQVARDRWSALHRLRRAITVHPPTQPAPPPAATWYPVRVARMPALDPGRHPRGRAVMPPLTIADAVTPPSGSAGAATFVYNIEDGATITYEWPSVVRKAWSGKESRASLARTPRQRFEMTSLLSDAQMRAVLEVLEANSADAPAFLLGLPHEELRVAGSTSSSITVDSLALCDWAVSGQRIVVVGRDGTTTAETWISGTPGGVTIPVGSDVSAVALDGARVMPAVAVVLEAEQGFDRHRVGVMQWDLRARATQVGYGATTQFGVGVTVAEHDGMAVWDRGNVTSRVAQPLLSDTDAVDQGLGIDAIGKRDQSDWRRQIRIESSDASEWQWFKAFLADVRGRSQAFLAPTGRPDLVPVGDASTGTLTVTGADYTAAWFPSLAHRRVKLVFADGTHAYRTVNASVDNGDGTHDLTLASAAAGTLDRVEFLETVRLDSDEIGVHWSGFSFESSLQARVVQQ